MQESTLYIPVRNWLSELLARQHGRSAVRTAIGADRLLSAILREWGLLDLVPGGIAFEIRIDVVGAVTRSASGECGLYLVEVKSSRITLSGISQLLGYCRVTRPAGAWIVSPAGWSGALQRLVRDYGRSDILEFYEGRRIVVGRWDLNSQSLRPGGILYP